MKTNEINIDNLYDILGGINDIKSSMVLLQQAVQNEYNPPELSDIDNNLEIIIEKFNMLIPKYNDILKKIDNN